jgi:DNA ligase-1
MDRLAEVCEQVAAAGARSRKVRAVAEYLRGLDGADLGRAVRFLCGRPVAGAGKKLSIGAAVLRAAALRATGWDEDLFRVCHREVGDTGETIALLLARNAGAPLSLAEADALYQRVLLARRKEEKIALLAEAFRGRNAAAVKYFVKTITGNLRIGLQEKLVEEAVAAACGAPLAAVRAANARLGDLASVAQAARAGTLDAIEARLFHPLDFMLAQPVASVAEISGPEQWLLEDKYDGIRAQVHWSGGRVRIFSRGRDDVTASFPELVEAFARRAGAGLADGEILGWRDGRALSFNALQTRLARKKVTEAMRAAVPVVFVAYDLLHDGRRLLLDLPLEERRAALEREFGEPPLLLSPQRPAESAGEIERAFAAARERGNEGLVLKRRGSRYEAGRRSELWRKVKRPYGTLDVVITAAEQGHGRRATLLSDYTFAVRDGGRFVNVGKAYSGLTDAELRELTRRLRASATGRYGRVFLVAPEIVLEVAFDGVQKSPRHKSGFALRFPRILAWRQDKTAAECDDLAAVRALYERSL